MILILDRLSLILMQTHLTFLNNNRNLIFKYLSAINL